MIPEVGTIKKTPNGSNVVPLFTTLFNESRVITIFNEINDELAAVVVAELLVLDSANNEDIHLYINSPGGSVTAGMAIIDAMGMVESDVCTYGIGSCASMGAMILAAGKPGKRYALPHTEIMIHQVLGGVSGQATDVEITANHLKQVKNQLNQMLADFTEQPLEKIGRDTERDYFMLPEQAKAYHLIDEIL